MQSEVLFLGGRSGVGKSSVAFELHAQLAALKVKHCVINRSVQDIAADLLPLTGWTANPAG
ncbi:hypothetical protein [Arthrobacter oryzae]|jgi:2-phosphoglycerate kinase|uniref:hypothetical protein n=1 Tax=Arthrobacter oryzae TaxID=409290 RepID=UPI0027859277|nr:hypothetical protein [Arthrobacter oryzae]MDQ0077973.1 2-phosphoglycerate kinase [Arthrobacter oryzae]